MTRTIEYVTTTTTASNGTTLPYVFVPFFADRPPEIAIPAAAIEMRQSPPKNAARKHQWYSIQNAAESDAAEVYIFDEITDPFMSDLFGIGISASGFRQEIFELRGKNLTVHINSPGGSVFEGLAIYNLLRQHDAQVDVIVDGIAASIASVIAMAGDTVTMAPHSMMMIHEPWGMTIGNAADHEKQAAVLNTIAVDIAGVYADRADKRVNWRQKMADETWLTDDQAVKLGLADRIDTAAPAATNKFDLSRFRNPPSDLAESVAAAEHAPTVRDAEQALRDAGLSARAAKAILAHGWADDDDDRDDPSILGAAASEDGSGATETEDIANGTLVDDPLVMDRVRLRLMELALV